MNIFDKTTPSFVDEGILESIKKQRTKENPLIKKIDIIKSRDFSEKHKVQFDLDYKLQKNVERKSVILYKNYEEIIQKIDKSSREKILHTISGLLYHIIQLPPEDYKKLTKYIESDEYLFSQFYKVITLSKYFNTLMFKDVVFTKDNIVEAFKSAYFSNINKLNKTQHLHELVFFFSKNFKLIKSLDKKTLASLESIFHQNSTLWNFYYNNIKFLDEPPKNLSIKTTPVDKYNAEYLMQNMAHKSTFDPFELNENNLNNVRVEKINGVKCVNMLKSSLKIYKRGKTPLPPVEYKIDKYDIVKAIFNFFNIKSHFNKILNFTFKQIDTFNNKVQKFKFLMSLDREKRDALKNLDFNHKNINSNSTIVKLIINRGIDFNKIQKKREKLNSLNKSNHLLFE